MAVPATLAEALVAFQKNAPHIAKDSVNPHFKNKYASLDAIMDAVRAPLAEQGLAISQWPCVLENGSPGLRTILFHAGGDRYTVEMPLSVEKSGPQAQGSALTYARRYSVLGVLGLVADEDDDANAAERPRQQKEAAATGAAAGGVDPAVGLTAELLAAAEKLAVKEGKPELAVQVADAAEVKKQELTPAQYLEWLRLKVEGAQKALEAES